MFTSGHCVCSSSVVQEVSAVSLVTLSLHFGVRIDESRLERSSSPSSTATPGGGGRTVGRTPLLPFVRPSALPHSGDATGGAPL